MRVLHYFVVVVWGSTIFSQTLESRLPDLVSFSTQQLKASAAATVKDTSHLFPRFASVTNESFTFWINRTETSYVSGSASPTGDPETLITIAGQQKLTINLPAGKWHTVNEYDWTAGFFPGCLWYGYELSGDTALLNYARTVTPALENAKNYTGTHDLGFIIFCSYGNAYRLTGDQAYKDVVLRAADRLALRYYPAVEAIRSWDWGSWQCPVIIDNMMNLEMLFWAAANGGDAALATMAHNHALTTRKNHVRADNTTYHVVDYNPNTGAAISRETWQGYSDESTWSRGQAWAVHGFTTAYRETGDTLLLQTARNCADWFIGHLPADYVPYWDFEAPGIPDEPRDASAAACAASGLVELSRIEPDSARGTGYLAAAENILLSLGSPDYLARGTASPALLNHSTGSKPGNKEVDVSLVYADYYFLEALSRYDRLVNGTPVADAGRMNVRTVPVVRVSMLSGRQARITFRMDAPGKADLRLANISGRTCHAVCTGSFAAGTHRVDLLLKGAGGVYVLDGAVKGQPVRQTLVLY